MHIPFRVVHRPLLAVLAILTIFVLSVGLSACNGKGQTSALSREEKEAQTLTIAADYAQDQDLEQAEARLGELDIANATQWVVMLAERHIADGGEETVILPLAQLANALGSSSTKLALYLAPSPTPEPAALAPTATEVPPTLTPDPATSTPEPTSTPVLPTATPEPPTPTEVPSTPTPEPDTPTPTSEPQPQIIVKEGGVNARSGPSTVYSLLGTLEEGQEFEIVGRNEPGDWWQFCCLSGDQGWVFASLVDTAGPVAEVAVPANIPPPPATSTPAPPTATPEPTRPAIDFVVASVRLWGVEENGGYFDGASLHCGEKRQLRVIVQDVNGSPLNSVGVYGIYSKATQFTGDKGPGITEFVLGGGDDVRVVQDVDGREVTSEVATGLTTDPRVISDEHFIAAGYCSDGAGCEALRAGMACFAHYSWDVVFKRTY